MNIQIKSFAYLKFKISLVVSLMLIAMSVQAQTDIAVNVIGPVSAVPGSTTNFTVAVTNNGTGNATNVRVKLPAVSNFTATSVTCSAGAGTGASASCPSSLTLAALQGTGLVVPSLPDGSGITFTVTGTVSSTSGTIVTNTATVEYSSDSSTANNTSTINTGIFNIPCATTTYKLDIASTLALPANIIGVNGGTVNLVYNLSSGVAIPGIGNSFTVPVSYSDLNNQYGVDNRWQAIVEGPSVTLSRSSITLVPRTDGTGSLYNSLPASNFADVNNQLPSENPNSTDNVFTTKIANGNLNPLGKFSIAIGNYPTPPLGSKLVSQQFVNWNGINMRPMQSGWWLKPLLNTQVFSTAGAAVTIPVNLQTGQTYMFRYSAFGDGTATNSSVRGVAIGDSQNYVTYGYDDTPIINSLTPANQKVGPNIIPAALTVSATKWNTTTLPTYQWYSNTNNSNSGGTLITGATSASYTPNASAVEGTTYYYVIVKGDGTCSVTSSPVSVTISKCFGPDTDGDGIADMCDSDDDNDGILDTEECVTPIGPVVIWSGDGSYGLNPEILQPSVISNSGTTAASKGSGLSSISVHMSSYQLSGISTSTTSLSGAISENDYVQYQFTTANWNTSLPNSMQYIYDKTSVFHQSANTINYKFAIAISSDNFSTSTVLLSDLSSLNTNNVQIYDNPAFTLLPNTQYKVRVYFYSLASSGSILFDNYTVRVTGYCDTDGDGIPDYLDLDSDNDGCFDSIEGDENVTTSHLNANGSINIAAHGGINTEGVPNLVNLGGSADIGGDQGQGIGDSKNASLNSQCAAYCYKPGILSGTKLETKVGITSLNRAGSDNPDNWPMIRKGGWLALESKTKGFVLNRVAFEDADGNPATPETPVGIASGNFTEGMMVYDTTNKCMKLYTSTNGGSSYAWYCLSTQTCSETKSFTLNCSNAVINGDTPLDPNVNFTITIPYLDGDGSSYPQQLIPSTGTTGLTAVLAAGTLSNGSGNLVLTVTGASTNGGGSYYFEVSINGQVCNIAATITAEAVETKH